MDLETWVKAFTATHLSLNNDVTQERGMIPQGQSDQLQSGPCFLCKLVSPQHVPSILKWEKDPRAGVTLCYSFNFPRHTVPHTDKRKIKIHFLSDDKESVRSQVTERNDDALVQRTKDWEWGHFGFLPAWTPDRTWKLEKIPLPQNAVSYPV